MRDFIYIGLKELRYVYICPLCNALESFPIQCPMCQNYLDDHGKVTDYVDAYSSYMDIDIMKLYDGDSESMENHHCVHYLYCTNCNHEEIKAVKEIKLLDE